MSFARSFKHWIYSALPLSSVLSDEALNSVEASVADAETRTSAEFLVIIERTLPLSYTREDAPSSLRAEDLFAKYRCWDTEDNNGVLLYINLTDHAIELVVDRAAARVLSKEELDAVIGKLSLAFKTKDFAGGIDFALKTLSEKLSGAFPNKPVSDPLPNEPVVL